MRVHTVVFNCVILRTGVHHTPLSMGFSRQKHWSGWPFPAPGDLPKPGIKSTCLVSPALAGGFFTSWAAREAPPLGSKENKRHVGNKRRGSTEYWLVFTGALSGLPWKLKLLKLWKLEATKMSFNSWMDNKLLVSATWEGLRSNTSIATNTDLTQIFFLISFSKK